MLTTLRRRTGYALVHLSFRLERLGHRLFGWPVAPTDVNTTLGYDLVHELIDMLDSLRASLDDWEKTVSGFQGVISQGNAELERLVLDLGGASA